LEQYYVEYMRSYFGLLFKAFEALYTEGRENLECDLLDLVNRSGDETMIVPRDYLKAVTIRR
jgi:hypothetical protein